MLAVARALQAGDLRGARERQAALSEMVDRAETARADGPGEVFASTLRAKAIGAVLVDLATSGWEVSVEEGRVYVAAPSWSAGGGGLSPDEVRAEKERARVAMEARVRDEIEAPQGRRFVMEMERAVRVGDRVRSVASLLADGPSLAAALRTRGADAVRPYLQVADTNAGRDPETGLRLADVFRYMKLFWSFPMKAPPGRTTPFLVRDAGQPGHPVCGLIAIASPVPRLTPRDAALGWTPAWLEAVVLALSDPNALGSSVAAAIAQVSAGGRSGLERSSVVADLCALLRLPPTRSLDALVAEIEALPAHLHRRRASAALKAILEDLRGEVVDALGTISFDGFGVRRAEAMANPGRAAARLESMREEVYARWHESRRVGVARTHNKRLDRSAADEARAMRDAQHDPLYVKKRVTQAAALLGAWAEVAPVDGESPSERLAALALGARRGGRRRFTGGESVNRGLRLALLQRQNRLVAAQVADVCVCGAVPPYGPLLGGKLAALLALSRDVAAAYHERYDGRASEITSQMAARPVARPADLLALTTTSFYGVGSSQYERLHLPTRAGEVRWRFVGYSQGHGTLHFSAETAAAMDRLLQLETGRRLITSRFGEGPSERLRKIRDGLTRLGVDPEVLLQHGMWRLVYVAELAPGACRPGAPADSPRWRTTGPRAEEVAAAWRERWLARRLVSAPRVIDEVERFDRDAALIGNKVRRTLPQEDGET